MENLNIVCLQIALVWENPQENIAHIASKILELTDADVIVLPEMFTTGFTMHPKGVADNSGEGLSAMKRWSAAVGACIIGSIAVEENGCYYNRLYAVFPDETFLHYDKRHLFRFASEDRDYTAGKSKLIFSWKGWKICPLICYDLRFPVWSKNTIQSGRAEYDLLIYVANWPHVRRHPWERLLFARAIENQSYVVGCNRVGEDKNDIIYSGGTFILDAKGAIIAQGEDHESCVVQGVVNKSTLEDFRAKFPVLDDGDHFSISLD